jgi:hypothetical protein
MSHTDIHSGERWQPEVSKNLETSDFGIFCITEENLNSSWMLFEGGALSKKVESSRIVPLLFGVELKNIPEPFKQFQSRKADKDGIYTLINEINNLSYKILEKESIATIFNSVFAKFNRRIAKIERSKQIYVDDWILDDEVYCLISIMNNISEELKQVSKLYTDAHTNTIQNGEHEISEFMKKNALKLMPRAETFRNKIPWLYDITLECYRSQIQGDIKSTINSYSNLLITLRSFILEPKLLPDGINLGQINKFFQETQDSLNAIKTYQQ